MPGMRTPAGVLRDILRKLLRSMYVLGLNGSPRKGGNTQLLLGKALEGARDAGAGTEEVGLNGLGFSACQECDYLKDDGSCIIDDAFQPLYKKVEKADALIMASPVFFGSLSAQSKTMIDRFQCAWRAKNVLKKDPFVKKKQGIFISVQASDRRQFFENSRSIVRNFFSVVNTDYAGELFCAGVEGKGDILRKREFLQKAYELGQKIAKTEVI